MSACGLSRAAGITLPANGSFVSGSRMAANALKSPSRIAAVGTLGANEYAATPRIPSKSAKKNVLSFWIGPPIVPPYVCRFWNGFTTENAFRASSALLRTYQKRLP